MRKIVETRIPLAILSRILAHLSRPVLAGFEYRACISRYLKAKHCVSDRLLAAVYTVGAVMASIVYHGRAFSVDGKFLKLLNPLSAL